MNWPFPPIWKDETVFILGGGPSVSDFPTHVLNTKKVIGCNNAYVYGEGIVDLLIFGDEKWYEYHRLDGWITNFRNPVISNCFDMKDVPGVIWAPRKNNGYFIDALGWNGNTGSSAINLALILGAKRICLVGFDMKFSTEGFSNWHPNFVDTPVQANYDRYLKAMGETVSQIEEKWPGVEIINLNPDSALNLFPKMSWKQYFEKELSNE
jgi:hypothetical protein